MSSSTRRTLRARQIGAVVAGLIAVGAIDAAAHDTWLAASAGTVKAGEAFTLSLTSGEIFPVDDFAIEPARVTRAVQRMGGATSPMVGAKPTPASLRYEIKPRSPGIATYGIELGPKTLTLEPSKIDEYLGEIDASPALRATWKTIAATGKAWVESYSKHATAFVRVLPANGDASAAARDSGWASPLGFSLEIVPLRDPTGLHAGDTLGVRVLSRGSPMRDFAVGAIHEGSDKANFFHTNADGVARIVLPSAGRWLLNGTDLRRSTDPRYVWQSDFVTATLFVARR